MKEPKCNCVKCLHLSGAVLCPDCQQPKDQPSSEFQEFMEDVKDEIRNAPKMFRQLQKRDELIKNLQARLDESEASRKELLEACKAQEKADEWFGPSDSGRKLRVIAKDLRLTAIAKAEKERQ